MLTTFVKTTSSTLVNNLFKSENLSTKQIIGYSVVVVAVAGSLIYFLERKEENTKQANRKEMERTKHDLRTVERIQQHDLRTAEEDHKFENRVRLENLRHEQRKEQALLKNNGGVVLTQNEKHELHKGTRVEDILKGHNVPNPGIEYLGKSPIQRKDIALIYSRPGCGKSSFTMRILSVATGQSQSILAPVSNIAPFYYDEAWYYDLEMTEEEWEERLRGTEGLNRVTIFNCIGKNAHYILNDIQQRVQSAAAKKQIIAIDHVGSLGLKRGEVPGFYIRLKKIQEEASAHNGEVAFYSYHTR